MALSLAEIVVIPACIVSDLEAVAEIPPLGPPAPMLAEDYDHKAPRDLKSIFIQADAIDAQVQVAMVVVRGTGSSVAEDGQRFGDIKKLDESAPIRLEDETRIALARLVDAGDIRIESVSFEQFGIDSGELTLVYMNLRAPTSDQRRDFTKVIG